MTEILVLYEAVYCGGRMTVSHATQEEIHTQKGIVDQPSDIMTSWSLIALRVGSVFGIHALGWRVLLQNTWITSRVTAIDHVNSCVQTRSGNQYSLGDPDVIELNDELFDHLGYALRTWGYKNVQPIRALRQT